MAQGDGSAPRAATPARSAAPAARDFEIVGNVLKAYRGNDADVVVPAGVVAVGNGAFAGLKGIRSVTLPDGVTEIEDRAFSDCHRLEQIRLPDSLQEIGWGAFSGCASLQKIPLPNGVKEIKVFAFSSCTGLQSIRIPDAVKSLDSGVFSYCTGLRKISFPRHKGMPDASVFPNAQVEYRDKAEEQQIRADRRKQGICEFCGGTFEGRFTKICTHCGRRKSY